MFIRGLKIIALWLLGSLSAWALYPPKIVVPPHETDGEPALTVGGSPTVIGCWNIEWFPGRNPRQSDADREQKQITGVNQILAAQSPDIFFACEIRSLADLKKIGGGYPFRACTEFKPPAGDDKNLPNQGLAILSRRAWDELWALEFSTLPAAPNRPARGILGAKFTLPDGRPLTVYAAHLKSNFGAAAANRRKRESAIDYLEWDWQRRKLDPARDAIILLGDFNTSVHDPVFAADRTLRRLFALGFTDAADGLSAGERVTIPASSDGYPDNDFDHILISKPLRERLSAPPPWVKIIPVHFTVSDHYPLFISVR